MCDIAHFSQKKWFSPVNVWIFLTRTGSHVTLSIHFQFMFTGKASPHNRNWKKCGSARFTFEFFGRGIGGFALLVHFLVHDEAWPHNNEESVVHRGSRLNSLSEELVVLIFWFAWWSIDAQRRKNEKNMWFSAVHVWILRARNWLRWSWRD